MAASQPPWDDGGVGIVDKDATGFTFPATPDQNQALILHNRNLVNETVHVGLIDGAIV